ncbi:sialidase family protein [Paenibacillus filicis]|uniref:Sialidase family protein n=1 Tax=Paenibacillus filicis TaxID=669464 RepID=A0ABU9DI91_9BACL
MDTTGSVQGMGRADTGFYIAEEKTAIVYGFANGQSSQLHVLISEDMGKTWTDTPIPGSAGYDTKFIGFTNKAEGWIVSGGSAGAGRSLNHVYQTSDGGKTWRELGNPNDQYTEQLTGAGFSSGDIGFLGYRYYADKGPTVYWTQDGGKSWEKLVISLSDSWDAYQKTPLSPVFNGKDGRLPILLSLDGEVAGTVYLTSKDYGLTWNDEEGRILSEGHYR